VRPSFLRTTPVKKPRMECGRQSVAGIVTPRGWRSRSMTSACLKLARGLDWTAFGRSAAYCETLFATSGFALRADLHLVMSSSDC
jgi:hypothetical protein